MRAFSRQVIRREYHDVGASFPTALTFDDVLLAPTLSTLRSRKDVSLKTRLSRNISLNNPIVSSNMDTVTEAKMAIAMAKAGGIGFLHRYLSPDEQVRQVMSVKRAEAFIIEEPYTISETTTLNELRDIIRRRQGVKSFLVVKRNEKLRGIITSRDLRFASDHNGSTTVADLMTPLKRIVRLTVADGQMPTFQQAQEMLQKHRLEKLPLVDAQGKVKGLITSRDLFHYNSNKHSSHDANHQLLVGAAVGVKAGDTERATRLVEAGVDCIVVDVAHGHSSLCIEQVQALRKIMPSHVDLIAGNVATGEGALALAEAGADGIKIGVGPGSICTTRKVTGAGVPQLSAILDVRAALKANGYADLPCMADGGITTSGDITKALAAGADTVMLGSLLAGTDESPGLIITKNNRKVKIVRGMAGFGANISNQERNQGSIDRDIFDVVPEGVEATVQYRGAVRDIVYQLCGGLASGISYCGGTDIASMQRNARFVRITSAGKRESGSHDVDVIA